MRNPASLITPALPSPSKARRHVLSPLGLVGLACIAALILYVPLHFLVRDAKQGGALSAVDLAAVKQALMAADEYACDANQTAFLPARTRPPPAACRHRWYLDEAHMLPAAELVVAVPPDACWSAVIRTVALAVVRSPPDALPRVWIASSEAPSVTVKAAMDYLPRVRLLHVPDADGTWVLRQEAAKRIKAPVTAFLSPGVLPHAGWLEPLVAEFVEDGIKKRRATLALPAIPPRKSGAAPPTVGHDWALRRMPFGRGHMSGFVREMARAESPLLPHGDFAVTTAFWRRFGGVGDFGGATELALRAWACGGAIATVPCSRIAAPRNAELRSLEREERIAVAYRWLGPYAMLAAFANGYEPNGTVQRGDVEGGRCGDAGGGFGAYMGAAFPEMQSSAQIMLGHEPWRGPRAWGRLRLWGTRRCVSYRDRQFVTERCEDAAVMLLSRLGYLMAAPRLTATCMTRRDESALHSKRCDVFYFGRQHWEVEPKRETAIFARIDGEPHCLTSIPGGKLNFAACLPMRAARQSWIWEYRASDDSAGNDLGEEHDEPVEGVQR